MITKLLDGLEVFLDVGVMSLNSSNLDMAGGWHIYSPPSRESRYKPLPTFLRWHRLNRWVGTGVTGHTRLATSRWPFDAPVLLTQPPSVKPMHCTDGASVQPVLKGSVLISYNIDVIAPTPCSSGHRFNRC